MPLRCRTPYWGPISIASHQNTTLGKLCNSRKRWIPRKSRKEKAEAFPTQGRLVYKGRYGKICRFFQLLFSSIDHPLGYGTAWPRSSVPRPHSQTIHPPGLDYLFPLHSLSQHRLDAVVVYQARTARNLDCSVCVYRDSSHYKVWNKNCWTSRIISHFRTSTAPLSGQYYMEDSNFRWSWRSS